MKPCRDWIPFAAIIGAVTIAVLMVIFCTKANADVYEAPFATCDVTWDQEALWIYCEYNRTDLVAPEDIRIWSRTSIEAYAGSAPRPWKWFCDLDGRQREQPADMVYLPESVICTANGKDRIETGLKWSALGLEPTVGTIVPFGLKINARLQDTTNANWKNPDALNNDPATFSTFQLTNDNWRGPPTPDKPEPPKIESGLMLSWDPQDDAEWFWVYVTRDGAELGKVRAETNEWSIDPVVIKGTSYYKFEVSADAEELSESERSDPFETWIVALTECEPVDCPAPPPCPDCPDPVECPDCPSCPDIPECPECPSGSLPLPQIQEIIIRCQ